MGDGGGAASCLEVKDKEVKEVESFDQSSDKAIICIDTSFSPEECFDYYNRINTIINGIMNQYKDVHIVEWNTERKIIRGYIEEFDSDRTCQPFSFFRFLQIVDRKYHLIVITNSEIFYCEAKACDEILKNSNVLSNILSFKIHFIGNVSDMNSRLSDLFVNVKEKTIVINDQEPIQIMDIDVDKLTYNDFLLNDNIFASVWELVKLKPDAIEELRDQLSCCNDRVLDEIAKLTIREYLENDDVDGCVNFVRNFDPNGKAKFENVMGKLYMIFFGCDDLYSLSHLNYSNSCNENSVVGDPDRVEEIPADRPEGTDSSDDSEESSACSDEEISYSENSAQTNEYDVITCNIRLIKSKNPCAEIFSLKNNEDSVLFDDESKLILQSPWLILNKQEIINKIIKHVGNYTYELVTNNRLDEACTHYSSAFARQEIYGVFMFHCNNPKINYDTVFQNNNRALSFIFNKNYQLHSNKSIWNVLFLYILGKYHPYWKEQSKIIHEELINILRRLNSFVTFSPSLHPMFIDRLDASLWYIIKVSHQAFPDSAENVLRFIEGSDRLIELYEFIYPDQDVGDIKLKVETWNFKENFFHKRTCIEMSLEVMSRYRYHEIVNENIMLLLGCMIFSFVSYLILNNYVQKISSIIN